MYIADSKDSQSPVACILFAPHLSLHTHNPHFPGPECRDFLSRTKLCRAARHSLGLSRVLLYPIQPARHKSAFI